MAVPQQKFREVVFQMLYSFDMGRTDDADIIELLMKELSVTRKTTTKALERVQDIIAIQKEVDSMISQASFSYAFERIQSVERNILRLGVYELFFDEDIPPKVAISEAMRLARKFGSPESATFINAVLDTLYKASLGEEVDPQKITDSILTLTKSEQEAQKVPPKSKSKK
jgi:N utilization substance protein B